jgi:hypothetical protein
MNVANVEEVNNNRSFLVYNNNSSKNILFIGSCRTVPLMFYYNSVTKDRNVYSILVHKHPTVTNDIIQPILKNTDIIICENVQHFDILNTNVICNRNFFKHFNVRKDIAIHYIPNLELRMFYHDVMNVFNIDKKNVYDYFLVSRQRLVKRIIEFGYGDLWHDITEYMCRIRMFSTFNHPTRILSCLMFKHMSKKLGLHVNREHYEEFLKHPFLEGNDTPVFEEDIETYSFTFPYSPSSSELLEKKNVYVRAIESKVDCDMFL